MRWPLCGWRLRITATDYCRTACCISSSLNGVQLGMLLFLLAAGFLFGIMDLVNLAHGSLYMLGAYFAAALAVVTGSFVITVILAVTGSLLVGMVLEVVAIRRLYERSHLDHVLGAFGLILFFNELVRLLLKLATWRAGELGCECDKKDAPCK